MPRNQKPHIRLHANEALGTGNGIWWHIDIDGERIKTCFAYSDSAVKRATELLTKRRNDNDRNVGKRLRQV